MHALYFVSFNYVLLYVKMCVVIMIVLYVGNIKLVNIIS